MPYSSGIITIGLASSDYLTCDAAIADYTGGIVGLSGDLTWIIEADTTWTSNFNLYDHNGFTFKITSKKPHNGNVNAGFSITLDAAVEIYVAVSTLGTTTIEKIKLIGIAWSSFYVRNMNSVGLSRGANVILRELVIVDTFVWTKQSEALSVRLLAYNNLLINSRITYDYTNGATPFASATSVIENNSFGSGGGVKLWMVGGAGGVSKANLIVRNNVAQAPDNNSFQFAFPGLLTPLAYNNASSGTTAVAPLGGTWQEGSSGNVGGILDSEFESLVTSSADFMRLQKIDAIFVVSGNPRKGTAPLPVKFEHSVRFDGGSKVLYKGGVVPSLSSVDLAGEAYGEFGHYPIGCYNAQANPLRDFWEE